MYFIKRFTHIGIKLLGTLAVAVYVYLMVVWQIPCWMKTLVALPCPGCGMTRAWAAALHGNLWRALSLHPWFWSVPILYLYILADGKLLGRPKADAWIIGICLGGFVLVFLGRLLIPAWRAVI